MCAQDNVGWNDQNQALARQLEVVISQIRCPWVLALDGNMEPEEFASFDVINRLPSTVVATAEGTCRYRGNWKRYDYFFVDNRLMGFAPRAAVCHEWPSYPHMLVALALAAPTKPLPKAHPGRASDIANRSPDRMQQGTGRVAASARRQGRRRSGLRAVRGHGICPREGGAREGRHHG